MAPDPALAGHLPENAAATLPRHIGVIMDGNGRWATARGRPRTDGHRAGVESLKKFIRLSAERGIGFVTAFSFSSENWRRPKREIDFLFSLIRRFVASDLEQLVSNQIKVVVLGEREGLDDAILRLIDQVESRTANGDRMQLNLAFNYGSRNEIARAARHLAEAAMAGEIAPSDITPEAIDEVLYTAGMPAPDLVLRTGGEQRLSNFLLWQAAYAEFIFIDELWPDFNEDIFDRVLAEFGRRQRRFGGLGESE